MLGWLAPGGASQKLDGWTERDGTKVQRHQWVTQAEQVAYLRAVVDVYREREAMRRLAVAIVFDQYHCGRKDKLAQALAIGNWVKDHVTYVEELPERFYLPLRLLAEVHPAADCDDFTVLIASLCESLGITCRLVAASWRGGYRHIWPEANVGTRWVVLDGTMAELASLYKGIEKAIHGNRVGDIAYAIQEYTEKQNGYGVVRDLVGHGLGRHLHEEPQVPNFGKRGTGAKLKEGMVIAIEPMINLGTKDVFHDQDGWTIRTADGKPAAHYEHDICIQRGKADILSSFTKIEAAEKANPDLCSDY